jgi:hypothetical protein
LSERAVATATYHHPRLPSARCQVPADMPGARCRRMAQQQHDWPKPAKNTPSGFNLGAQGGPEATTVSGRIFASVPPTHPFPLFWIYSSIALLLRASDHVTLARDLCAPPPNPNSSAPTFGVPMLQSGAFPRSVRSHSVLITCLARLRLQNAICMIL